MTMKLVTTTGTGATVVSLESHPGWRAGQQRSADIAAAMRRHPSCRGMNRVVGTSGSVADVLPLPKRWADDQPHCG